MSRLQFNKLIRVIDQPRRILAMAIMAICVLIPFQSRAEEIFAELAKNKQVESTYISGRFASTKQTWRSMSGRRALNLGDGFSAMYTYQCYSKESVDLARSILEKFLKKNPDVEVMMRSKELSGEYCLYERFNKDGDVTLCLIWNCEAPSQAEVVVVDLKNGYKRGQKYTD